MDPQPSTSGGVVPRVILVNTEGKTLLSWDENGNQKVPPVPPKKRWKYTKRARRDGAQ